MGNDITGKGQVNRKQAPKIKDAIEFSMALKPYEKFTLDNGIDVYAVHAGPEEVIQLEWVFRAGNWYEKDNGVAGATNFLLKNGTSKRSAFEISEHFDFYGSYLNRNCYNETSNITLHSLSKHIPELLPLVTELIMDPVFPQLELDIYKQNMKQRLEVNLKKCDFVANRLIDEYLYGFDHPYGRYGTFESYEAINREQLVQYHDRYYKNGHCTIFVAGLLPKDLKEQLNKNFGSLPLNKNEFERFGIKVQHASQKKYRIDNDKDGVQGAVRIARPFIDRKHPDFFGSHVLNTLFGGFFGSRLMSNIREDKGYTYGIHSYFQNHISDSSWLISTEAGKDVCEQTIQEVYHEMKVLREEAVDEEELLLVKNYMLGSVLGDLDGPFHIIGRWKNIILNELPNDYFEKTIEAIKKVSSKDIQILANKYLRQEDFYELVVV